MRHPQRRVWAALAGLAATVALLASALAFLHGKTRTYGELTHFENLARLHEIQHLDAHWELDALKSRVGITTHYDALVHTIVELHALHRELESLVANEISDAPPALAQSVETLGRAIVQKGELVERFKSHNAVLRNSLAFLPAAANDVQRLIDTVLAQDPAGHALARLRRIPEDTDDLLLAAFVYGHDGTEDMADEVETALGQIDDHTRHLPDDVRERLEVFAAHARTVLREHRVVIGLLNEIAAVSLDRHIEDIEGLLADRHRHDDAETLRYRGYLLAFAILLMVMLVPAAVSAIRNHAAVRRINRELQEANEKLEERVRERTRQLHETQAELVAAARHAGMAEIATNVLHNVGNVLNSVNVSATEVFERVRTSKGTGLDRAVALMNEHATDLGRFLTDDAKGRLLPGYLAKLSEALAAERAALIEELSRLTASIDHIKEVVAMQQTYAGSSQLIEPVQVRDLIEDALRMNATSLARHDVRVVKEVCDLPEMPLDRHRLLQILVNLISNAKQAMGSAVERPHRLTLRAAIVGTDQSEPRSRRLQIRVEDTGEGIPAENLTRIFNHGFTTRRNGHGFGLHSCALAAREMGGTLVAHSDGRGRGAVFTLELPLPAEALSERPPAHLPASAAA